MKITKRKVLEMCYPKIEINSSEVSNFLISYREICKSFNCNTKADGSYSQEDRQFFGQVLQLLYAEGMLGVVNKSPDMNIPHLDAQYFITEKGIKELVPWYSRIEFLVAVATIFTGVSALIQVYGFIIEIK